MSADQRACVTVDVLVTHNPPRGHLDGLNLIGLKRRGVSRAEIAALRSLLADLGRGAFRDSARTRAEGTVSAMEREVLDFILGPSDRSFLAPRPA